MSDEIGFETAAQSLLRRARRGQRSNGQSQLIGYLDPGGQKLALTGDEEAPYVKVINTVTISPIGTWTQYNNVLGTPDTAWLVYTGAGRIGRISLTGDAGSSAMYALIYDGVDVTGTLIDRFYIPAEGTGVRDWTFEGGLEVSTGIYIALTTDPGAVTAPGTGGFLHGIYRAA